MPKKTFKCPKCDRTFSMAGHLGRHMTATHGRKKRKKAAKRAKKRSGGWRKKRVGRPKGVAARVGLKDMSLEQLTQVIDAARGEARRKLAALEEAIG